MSYLKFASVSVDSVWDFTERKCQFEMLGYHCVISSQVIR